MFSLRILITDHYMTKPVRGLDVRYSDFRGREVDRVPVLRIYGSTPVGQKTCLHIHGIFPYLYVPFDEPSQNAEQYTQQFSTSLDKAMNVACGRASSTEQHVYKVILVTGIPMYGYHEKEQQFLKIYLYNPATIRKAADLLIGGAVMNRTFQPHESHIPYPLQIFIDYNLYGMNMINLAAVKFRRPVASSDGEAEHSDDDIIPDSLPPSLQRTGSVNLTQTWHPHNIPRSDLLDEDIERQSTCELEVDAVAADILNRLEVTGKTGTNPGLVAIWEDERQRRREAGTLSQLTPPLSPVREFSGTVESEEKLRARYADIIDELEPFVNETLIDSQSRNDESFTLSRQASQVELHTSQNTPEHEDWQLSSQDTVIMDTDEVSSGPIIDVPSIQQIVSSSQHFLDVSTDKDPTDDRDQTAQDIELVNILESLASHTNDDIPGRLSRRVLSQVSVLEEHDSALGETVVALSAEALKEDESDEVEMSQRIWDDGGEDRGVIEDPGETSLDMSEVVADSFCADNAEDIPQLDGTSDIKPVTGVKRRGRPPGSGRGRGSRGPRGRGNRRLYPSDIMYLSAEYSAQFDEFVQQRLLSREYYTELGEDDFNNRPGPSTQFQHPELPQYMDANRNYVGDEWAGPMPGSMATTAPPPRVNPERSLSPARCPGSPCNDPNCLQSQQRCSPCNTTLTDAPFASRKEKNPIPGCAHYPMQPAGMAGRSFIPYCDAADNRMMPPLLHSRAKALHPHPYLSARAAESPAPTPPPRQFMPDTGLAPPRKYVHPPGHRGSIVIADNHDKHGPCQCPDCRQQELLLLHSRNTQTQPGFSMSEVGVKKAYPRPRLPARANYSHDAGFRNASPNGLPNVVISNGSLKLRPDMTHAMSAGEVDRCDSDGAGGFSRKQKNRYKHIEGDDISRFTHSLDAVKQKLARHNAIPHTVTFSLAESPAPYSNNEAYANPAGVTAQSSLTSQPFTDTFMSFEYQKPRTRESPKRFNTKEPFSSHKSPPSFAPNQAGFVVPPPVPSRHLKTHGKQTDNPSLRYHKSNPESRESSNANITSQDQGLFSNLNQYKSYADDSRPVMHQTNGNFHYNPSANTFRLHPAFPNVPFPSISRYPNNSTILLPQLQNPTGNRSIDLANNTFGTTRNQPINGHMDQHSDYYRSQSSRQAQMSKYSTNFQSLSSTNQKQTSPQKTLVYSVPECSGKPAPLSPQNTTDMIEPATPYQNVPNFDSNTATNPFSDAFEQNNKSFGNMTGRRRPVTDWDNNIIALHAGGMNKTPGQTFVSPPWNIAQRQSAEENAGGVSHIYAPPHPVGHNAIAGGMPPPVPQRNPAVAIQNKHPFFGRSQSESSSFRRPRREGYNNRDVMNVTDSQDDPSVDPVPSTSTDHRGGKKEMKNFNEKIENLFRETLGDMSDSPADSYSPVKPSLFFKPPTLFSGSPRIQALSDDRSTSPTRNTISDSNVWQSKCSYLSDSSVNSTVGPLSASDDYDGRPCAGNHDDIFMSLASNFEHQSTLNTPSERDRAKLPTLADDGGSKKQEIFVQGTPSDVVFGILAKSDIFQTMSSAKSPDMGETSGINVNLPSPHFGSASNDDAINYTTTLPSFSPGDYYMQSILTETDHQSEILRNPPDADSTRKETSKNESLGNHSASDRDFGDPEDTVIDGSSLVEHTERLLQSLLCDNMTIQKDNLNKLINTEEDFSNVILNTPLPTLNTPYPAVPSCTPQSSSEKGPMSVCSSSYDQFVSRSLVKNVSTNEVMNEKISEEAEAVRNLQKALGQTEDDVAMEPVRPLSQMRSEIAMTHVGAVVNEQQKMVRELLQPLNDHLQRLSSYNQERGTEDGDEALNSTEEENESHEESRGISDDSGLVVDSSLTEGHCSNKPVKNTTFKEGKCSRKLSESRRDFHIQGVANDIDLSDSSSDLGNSNDGSSLLMICKDVDSVGDGIGDKVSEENGISGDSIFIEATTDQMKQTSGNMSAAENNKRDRRDSEDNGDEKREEIDVHRDRGGDRGRDGGGDERASGCNEGRVAGDVEEVPVEVAVETNDPLNINTVRDERCDYINVPDVLHSIQQLRNRVLPHGNQGDADSQTVLYDLMNSVSKLNADVQIIMQQLMKRQEQRNNEPSGLNDDVLSPYPLLFNPGDPLSIDPMTPAVDCLNNDRVACDDIESELWERCFRKLEKFQSQENFDEHIETPQPLSIKTDFLNPPGSLISPENFGRDVSPNDQNLPVLANHSSLPSPNILHLLSPRKPRIRSFSSVSLPSNDKKEGYSFLFHVPVPIYQRLKHNHPLRALQKTKLNRKQDELIVKIHPADARRYSLLKIGKEIVPLKRCKSDMDSPSETETSCRDSSSHSSSEQSDRSVEELKSPNSERHRLLALSTNYPKLSEIISKAIQDNIYSFKKTDSLSGKDADSDSLKTMSDTFSVNSSRRSSLASSLSYDSVKQVPTTDMSRENRDMSRRSSLVSNASNESDEMNSCVVPLPVGDRSQRDAAGTGKRDGGLHPIDIGAHNKSRAGEEVDLLSEGIPTGHDEERERRDLFYNLHEPNIDSTRDTDRSFVREKDVNSNSAAEKVQNVFHETNIENNTRSESVNCPVTGLCHVDPRVTLNSDSLPYTDNDNPEIFQDKRKSMMSVCEGLHKCTDRPGLFVSVLGEAESEHLEYNSDLSPPAMSPAYDSDSTSPPIMSPAYNTEHDADSNFSPGQSKQSDSDMAQLEIQRDFEVEKSQGHRRSLDSALEFLSEFQDSFSDKENDLFECQGNADSVVDAMERFEEQPNYERANTERILKSDHVSETISAGYTRSKIMDLNNGECNMRDRNSSVSPVSSTVSPYSITPMPSPWEEMGCHPLSMAPPRTSTFSQTTPRLLRINSSPYTPDKPLRRTNSAGSPLADLAPQVLSQSMPKLDVSTKDPTRARTMSVSSDSSIRSLYRSKSLSSNDTSAYNYEVVLEHMADNSNSEQNGLRPHGVECGQSNTLLESLNHIRKLSKDSGRPLSIPVSLDISLLQSLIRRSAKQEDCSTVNDGTSSVDSNNRISHVSALSRGNHSMAIDMLTQKTSKQSADNVIGKKHRRETNAILSDDSSLDYSSNEICRRLSISSISNISDVDSDLLSDMINFSPIVKLERLDQISVCSNSRSVKKSKVVSVRPDSSSLKIVNIKDSGKHRGQEYVDSLRQFAMMSPARYVQAGWSPPQPTTPGHSLATCTNPTSTSELINTEVLHDTTAKSDTGTSLDSAAEKHEIFTDQLDAWVSPATPAYSDVTECSVRANRDDHRVIPAPCSSLTEKLAREQSLSVSENHGDITDVSCSNQQSYHPCISNNTDQQSCHPYNSYNHTSLDQIDASFCHQDHVSSPQPTYSDISEVSHTPVPTNQRSSHTPVPTNQRSSHTPEYSDISQCSPQYQPAHTAEHLLHASCVNSENSHLEAPPNSTPPAALYSDISQDSSSISRCQPSYSDRTNVNSCSVSLTTSLSTISDRTKFPSENESIDDVFLSPKLPVRLSRGSPLRTSPYYSRLCRSNQSSRSGATSLDGFSSNSDIGNPSKLHSQFRLLKPRNYVHKHVAQKRKLRITPQKQPKRYKSMFCQTLRVSSSGDKTPSQSDANHSDYSFNDGDGSSVYSSHGEQSRVELSSDESAKPSSYGEQTEISSDESAKSTKPHETNESRMKLNRIRSKITPRYLRSVCSDSNSEKSSETLVSGGGINKNDRKKFVRKSSSETRHSSSETSSVSSQIGKTRMNALKKPVNRITSSCSEFGSERSPSVKQIHEDKENNANVKKPSLFHSGDLSPVSSISIDLSTNTKCSEQQANSPISESNTDIVALIKQQIHASQQPARSVVESIPELSNVPLEQMSPGTPLNDELSEIVSVNVIEEQVFEEVIVEMGDCNLHLVNFVSRLQRHHQNIEDGISMSNEDSGDVEPEVEVVNFIAANELAPDVVIDLGDVANSAFAVEPDVFTVENPQDAAGASTQSKHDGALGTRGEINDRFIGDNSNHRRLQRNQENNDENGAKESGDLSNRIFRQFSEERCVITPAQHAPSWSEISDSALSYGLDIVNNQAAYCSNVKDIPERTREVAGKLKKLDSNSLSCLPEFVTNLQLQTLRAQRNKRAFESGVLSSLNSDLNDEMAREPALRYALTGDGPCVITPCLPPPPYNKVRTWLEKHTTDLDARSNYSDFESERPTTPFSDIASVRGLDDVAQTPRRDNNLPDTSPISDVSRIIGDRVPETRLMAQNLTRPVDIACPRGDGNSETLFYNQRLLPNTSPVSDATLRTENSHSSGGLDLSVAPLTAREKLNSVVGQGQSNIGSMTPSRLPVKKRIMNAEYRKNLQTGFEPSEIVPSSYEDDGQVDETLLFLDDDTEMAFESAAGAVLCPRMAVETTKNVDTTAQIVGECGKIEHGDTTGCKYTPETSEMPENLVEKSRADSCVNPDPYAAVKRSAVSRLPESVGIRGTLCAVPAFRSPAHSTPLHRRSSDLTPPSCTPIPRGWVTPRGPREVMKDTPRHRAPKRKLPLPVGSSMLRAVVTSQTDSSPAPCISKRYTSQLEGPSLSDTQGFKYSHLEIPGSKVLHEVQYLTTLSLELHAHSRGHLNPDPESDHIIAVFYSLHNDVPVGHTLPRRIDGVFVVENPSQPRSGKTPRKSPGKSAGKTPRHDTKASPSKVLKRESKKIDVDNKDAARDPGRDSGMSDQSTGSGKSPDEEVGSVPKTGDISKQSQEFGGQSRKYTGGTEPTRASTSTGPPNTSPAPSENTTNIPGASESGLTVSSSTKTGVTGLDVIHAANEITFFTKFVEFIKKWNPDIIVGYEIQMSSWGYLLHRAAVLSVDLCTQISRIPGEKHGSHFAATKDQYGADYMSEIHIAGRVVLNLWRLLRWEMPLNKYSFENTAYHILHQRHPLVSHQTLNQWYHSHLHRWRTLEYYRKRCRGNMEIMDELGLVSRTSEYSRVFGIEYYDAILRGSQFRVESMMMRIAKPLNYIAVSPSVQQRARMLAPECIPLNIEPDSRFYSDPVIVLDFQSLYPSIMIAYNYCFTTCVGHVEQLAKCTEGDFKFGCTHLNISPSTLKKLEKDVTISPNGVVFVKQSVRQGVLPIMLNEILNTRIMVKTEMKNYKNDKGLFRMLHARQLSLKLIANTTYGYTAASFSGRMPCIELADSIVRKARETLERAIKMVNESATWRGRVVYGDTDSMFIELKGRTKDEAFTIGQQIADAVTADNPKPVKLKFEKVYLPCFLQSKKRYVGFMYESRDQKEAVYEAKGIETVRRDNCPAVSKILEKTLKTMFTTRDVSRVRSYLQSQLHKLHSGRVSVQDCIFAKEYRGMANYKPGACLPTLEIVRKLLRSDRRSEPRHGERVPYVIVYGLPGVPLIRLVRRPQEVISDPACRVNITYYVTKQILPAVQRFMTLLGVDAFQWHHEMPKVIKVSAPITDARGKKGMISQYFTKSHCLVCDEPLKDKVCLTCRADPQTALVSLNQGIRKWERIHDNLHKICASCLVGWDKPESCVTLDCPVLFRRVQAKQDLWHVQETREAIAKYLDV